MERSEEPQTVETDVVIVGAGIAGTTLAYLLARSGVNTVLVERHTNLAREFRGFGFQPLALRFFDGMDVLNDVYGLDPVHVDKIQIHAFGSSYTVADPTTYPEPYDHALFMEQPPLLRMFIEKANAFDSFDYRDGTPVTGLLAHEGTITGIKAKDRESDSTVEIRSRVVVAGDGRYSTVRNQLEIDPNRFESDVEIVWVKLPDATSDAPASIYVNEHGALANFGLPGGEVQLGLVIEAGTYPEIRERGFDEFKSRVAAIAPPFENLISEHLTGFEQCSLLQVAPGISTEWVRDGLVLIGDAAHVASPFGGQGNLMALEDAVALHPILVDALREQHKEGPLLSTSLHPFEAHRRPEVEETVRLQRQTEHAFGWLALHGGAIPPTAVGMLLNALFWVGGPFVRGKTRKLMLGVDPADVADQYFIEESVEEGGDLSEVSDAR